MNEIFSFDRISLIILMKFFLGPKNAIVNNIIKIAQKNTNASPISYSKGTVMFIPAIKISKFCNGKL